MSLAQTRLETVQDEFKNTLGLPPDIPIRLDDSLFGPFRLTAPPSLAGFDGCRTYAEVAGVIDDPDSASNVPCPILVLAFEPHWHTLPQDRTAARGVRNRPRSQIGRPVQS